MAPPLPALSTIQAEGRYPPLDLTPPRRKATPLEALARQLDILAACRPMLLAPPAGRATAVHETFTEPSRRCDRGG